MKRSRSRTAAILRKELIHIRRDTRSLIIAVLMPVALLIIYGYGVSSDVRNIRMVVVDWCRTRESRALVSSFVQSGYFRIVGGTERYADAQRMLDLGTTRTVLVVPTTFARDLAKGNVTHVQFLVDGSDPTTANVAAGYAEAIVGRVATSAVRQSLARRGQPRPRGVPPIDVRVRVFYNEELRSTNFIIPGLIAIILAMTAALLTSGTIAGERERGTMEQLAASPIQSRELMLGKIGAYSLLAAADVVLVILVGTFWFGVPLRGSVLLLMVASGIFLMAALGLGLLFSARMATQQTALTAAVLSTMVPSILLSGFYFPIRSMPSVIQVLTTLIPARYFMVITRGVFLKGVGWRTLWPQIAMLALLAAVILAGAIRAFRRKL